MSCVSQNNKQTLFLLSDFTLGQSMLVAGDEWIMVGMLKHGNKGAEEGLTGEEGGLVGIAEIMGHHGNSQVGVSSVSMQ